MPPSPLQTPRRVSPMRPVAKRKGFWQELLGGIPWLVNRQWELAKAMVAAEEYWDAAQRLRFLVWLKPEHVPAWHQLGCAYAALNEKQEAELAFREGLRLKPQDEEMRYMLAMLKGAALENVLQPHSSPALLMAKHFDIHSDGYDEEQILNKKYVAHRVLGEMLIEPMKSRGMAEKTLDIGCGTGLLGMLLRPLSVHVTGVDLSAGMLIEAQARQTPFNTPIYDDLVQDDMRHYLLQQTEARFDLIACGDAFAYVGGLAPVFDGVKKALRPNGIFAFTTEIQDGAGYSICSDDARFAHSDGYLAEQAARLGLTLLVQERKPMYGERLGRYSIYQMPAEAA